MSYPPVRHDQCSTPYLNAVLVLVVAGAVAFIAALAGLPGWLIAAGFVFLGALVRMGWLENR